MPEFDNEQLNLNPEELQSQLYKSDEAIESAITNELENKTPEELEELKAELEQVTAELDAEDLDKRNYVKIRPDFYLQPVRNEDEDDETELVKILNPIEGTVETRELTDDEKKEVLIAELKASKRTFNPLRHPTKVVGTITEDHVILKDKRKRQVKERMVETNKVINKYGTAYKQKRKRKNKMAKAAPKPAA